jgi:hypothetical protein
MNNSHAVVTSLYCIFTMPAETKKEIQAQAPTPKLRLLFILSVCWGASIFWLAPHPPMIDLPQHAGQVSLLKDLLLGQSPWTEQVRIHLLTPYLIGYGLALPLSFFMPVAAALKVVLSLAYIAFVFMCVTLRRHFQCDARLDWLFLLSFFGFAYIWGFYTFLVAAPIGLAFILFSDRFADHQTFARALGLVIAGLILLMSHGLVFIFAWCVGLGFVIARMPKFQPFLTGIIPFAILATACAGLILIFNHAFVNSSVSIQPTIMGWGLSRFPKALIFIVGDQSWKSSLIFAPAVITLVCAPWMLGLAIDFRNSPSWMTFMIVVLVLVYVPSSLFGSGSSLYHRFALFLPPAYAWMFTIRRRPNDKTLMGSSLGASIALPLLVATCWFALGINTVRALQFGYESADFDTALSAVEPNQRALALVFDKDSKADNNEVIYLHFPLWYQADKHGLVDFNFAWFPQLIVLFRPEKVPAIDPEVSLNPETFDWLKNRGGDYRYFFVRDSTGMSANLFHGADCPPVTLVTKGSWTVFERRACP